jgi:uncharacterized protein YjiS (DUF1127 family)
MFNNLKDAIRRANERRQHRRDYKFLLTQGNEYMLRDIGVDRHEVEQLYFKTGLL